MPSSMPRDEILYFKRPPLGARLICFNLAPQVTEEELLTLFSTFGTVQNICIAGEFAFITYYSIADAEHAMFEIGVDKNHDNMAAPCFYGKRIRVKKTHVNKNSDPKFDVYQHDEAVSIPLSFFFFFSSS